MTIVSFLLAALALALLALSMDRHARQAGWTGRDGRSGRLRVVGWGLLLLSLAARLAGPAWAIGLIEWIGQLALAAIAVMLVLTYRPTWLGRIARCLPPSRATSVERRDDAGDAGPAPACEPPVSAIRSAR